jgi:hypothetical protein
MIRTDDHLNHTQESLNIMERALLALTRDVPHSVNPVMFALMAEPIVDTIRDLRREIDEYIGLTFAINQQSQPEIAKVLDGTTFGDSEPLPTDWSAHSHPVPPSNARS